MHALRLVDGKLPEAFMFFRLSFDIILQEVVSTMRSTALRQMLGLRTPIGFAAVRMASEAILNVSDMVVRNGNHGHSDPLISVQSMASDYN